MTLPQVFSTRYSAIESEAQVSNRLGLPTAGLTISLFLPYLGLPIGNKSVLLLSSFIALGFIAYGAVVGLLPPSSTFFVFATPFITCFLLMLSFGPSPDPKGLVLWIANLLPLGGCYTAAKLGNLRVIKSCCQMMVGASCIFAIFQKIYLDRGNLIFPWLYSGPGYAPVDIELVTKYIHRPFAWYPEPSFLAVTIGLGFAIAMILEVYLDGCTSRTSKLLLGAVLFVTFLSKSGNALIVYTCLPVIAFSNSRHRAALKLLAIPAALAAVWVSLTISKDRNTTQNWSWNDRAASIEAGLDYLLASVRHLVFGVGRGATSSLYANGDIDADRYGVVQVVKDITSVSGRILLENGVIFGSLVMLVLIGYVYVGSRTCVRSFVASAIVLLWVFSITLTTSYESVALLWALPGFVVALSAGEDEGVPR